MHFKTLEDFVRKQVFFLFAKFNCAFQHFQASFNYLPRARHFPGKGGIVQQDEPLRIEKKLQITKPFWSYFSEMFREDDTICTCTNRTSNIYVQLTFNLLSKKKFRSFILVNKRIFQTPDASGISVWLVFSSVSEKPKFLIFGIDFGCMNKVNDCMPCLRHSCNAPCLCNVLFALTLVSSVYFNLLCQSVW